ncbi:MAG TPA: PAC2 family protein [Actinomycetota bacterium]|jgi:predicted ATP-grasp superfamily ATP-dependent carboligase
MEHVTFLERPDLDRPPLICAFRGWNDGGEAASIALRYLQERWGATTFATLDPEEFYDFQVTRPTVRLEEGVSRVIEWPKGEFAAASVGGRDVVLFGATEPNVRWRTFTGAVLGTAQEIGSSMLITLGAFLTDVPHSRPVPVVGSAVDEETAGRLGLARSQYEGPTGIVGVLHDASNRAGLPSVSLWAAVPHYLPVAPNPKAALALVERVAELLGMSVDTDPLTRAVGGWEQTVLGAVQESDELTEYVARLEAAADENVGRARLSEEQVPSGESIAAELERFLREQGDGDAER